MILTVTINPLLEHRLFFDNLYLGKGNRSNKEFFYAGGKGINVSRQLNHLGIKNSAFTFLGGNNGKLLRHCLTEDKIDFSVLTTKSETRIADLIIENSGNRITTLFGVNSEISVEESLEFKNRLDKMIYNCSTVIFSGSSPCITTDDIFPYGIELANKYDKISILDTYGGHLQACIDAQPTVIHNNKEEVENSLGLSLNNEIDKLSYLHDMYSKNIKMIFLTDGSGLIYASKFDFCYTIDPPKMHAIDPTGSGDAFVAGIAYGLENSLVFEDFVKIATALGAANAASLKTCEVTQDEMNLLTDKIKISSTGKKMKIIDDSPNYF